MLENVSSLYLDNKIAEFEIWLDSHNESHPSYKTNKDDYKAFLEEKQKRNKAINLEETLEISE